MDLASMLPPLMLDVRPGQKILDACAAPGGKSFAIASQLFAPEDQPSTGQLTCNDKSKKRRIRMASVLKSYVKPNLLGHEKIRFCGQSAEAFWPIRNHYDRILIDAPCSSERHIIHQYKGDIDAIGRQDWSVAKCSRLSKSQIKMIQSALHALKPGGRVVYSTCSLDYKQNDRVIEKICKKFGDNIHVISHDQQFEKLAKEIPLPQERHGHLPSQRVGYLEKLNKGWIALPDACGWGPLYVSVIEKSTLHSDNDKELE
jgi:16S rRNA C967 or C1407 C5-methylase (RsmB/RsmF family)